MTFRILILGGTTEAREFAARLAGREDLAVTLSMAGRTVNPVAQPVPVRIGGFGGPEGLADFLRESRTDLLVDATHPFAARISANASAAAAAAKVPLLVIQRPEWKQTTGDRWTYADSIPAAVAALGEPPRRVFVTLGRQELKPLEAAPQHHYVIRSVDPVEPQVDVPHAEYILDRGPFELAREKTLLEGARIDAILAKNSGGRAAYAKIEAARMLGIPVFLVRRPAAPQGSAAGSVDEALARLDHLLKPPAERGE